MRERARSSEKLVRRIGYFSKKRLLAPTAVLVLVAAGATIVSSWVSFNRVLDKQAQVLHGQEAPEGLAASIAALEGSLYSHSLLLAVTLCSGAFLLYLLSRTRFEVLRVLKEKREAQASLDLVMNIVSDPFIIKDDSFRFRYVNRAILNHMGKSKEELLGKTDYDFFPREVAGGYRKADLQVLQTGSELEVEEKIPGKTPSEDRTFLTKKFRFDKPDGGHGLVISIREITQLKAVERQLQAAKQEAEAANAAKSMFLATISHEVRTPMHGILSFARLGAQKAGSAPPEKLKSYFEEIHESGSRMLTLLNDLLDLSKLEAGKIAYNVHEGDLGEIARSVGAELTALAGDRGLTLAVEPSGRLDGDFDADRLMQVLRNLVSNAIKFAESGSCVRIVPEDRGDRLRCAVINRGAGIRREELESVFGRYVQSSKNTFQQGGTGLGLSICREIVLQHGGTIWAESDEGAETRFIFELPRRATARASAG